MKYRHKETGREVEALTFEELVAAGREQNPGREGPPWSFEVWGHHVTHETDRCYVVSSIRFVPGDVIVHQDGNLYRWGLSAFYDHFDPVAAPVVVTPTETEMIEATEKSANFMLGLAARARGALRLEAENVKLAKELDIAIGQIASSEQRGKTNLADALAAVEDSRNAAKRIHAEVQEVVENLRKALDAEGYDLSALASMAIQKIQDLDRSLTAARNDLKAGERARRVLSDRVEMLLKDKAKASESSQTAVAVLHAKIEGLERHIENEHQSAWRMLMAEIPETDDMDARSLVQRVIDHIRDLRLKVANAKARHSDLVVEMQRAGKL